MSGIHQINYNLWRDAQDTLWDLGELIWCTYGTTSTVGRNAQKVAQLWGYLRPRIEDVAYAEGVYQIEQRVIPETPNQFGFDWQHKSNMGHKLRRCLPLEYHQKVAEKFLAVLSLYDSLVIRYTLKASEGWTFKHLSRALNSLRSSLSGLFATEFPEHQNIYGTSVRSVPRRSSTLEHMAKVDASLAWPVTPQETPQALEVIRSLLEQDTRITEVGYGYPWGRDDTPEVHRTKIQESRDKMLSETFAHQFIHCCVWLDGVKVTKTPRINSYWLKHVVERFVSTYIPNGAMVAAVLYKRIPFKVDGINVLVAVSKLGAKMP